MVKQIKAIKCPHCSSIQKTKLDKDLYHCDNCNTDYFLDNDDVNININNKTSIQSENAFLSLAKNKVLIFIVCTLFGLIVILFLFINIWARPKPVINKTNQTVNTTIVKPISETPPKVDNTPKPFKYSNLSKVFYTYIGSDNQPYSFNIGLREFDSNYDKYFDYIENNDDIDIDDYENLNGFYYEVRDVKTGKLIKSDRLFGVADQYRIKDWTFRKFDNRLTYLSYGDNTLYVFDEADLSVNNVSNVLFNDYTEFSSGVAVANFSSRANNSLYVLTNNGKEYVFFPNEKQIIIDRSQAWSDKVAQLNSIENYAEQEYLRSIYCFVEVDEQIQLVKLSYRTKNIDPLIQEIGCKVERWVGNNRKTNIVYTVSRYDGDGPIEKTEVLVSDRLFFDPIILYASPEHLIIRAKNTASPQALYNLQSLDPNSGEIIWTVQGTRNLNFSHLYYLEENNSKLIPYQDGWIVQLKAGQYLLIANDGTTKEVEYKLEEIFVPQQDE